MGTVGDITYPDSGKIGKLKDLFASLAASVNDALQKSKVPAGSVFAFAGGTIPDGFLACDGTQYNTADEPALFAAIGYTYGGIGPTFNTPNLNARMVLGTDANDLAYKVAGLTGGEATHTLTIAEMPLHDHAQRVTANSGGTAIRRDYASDGPGGVYDQGVKTGGTGGGAAHNNMPPYMTMNYIIKA